MQEVLSKPGHQQLDKFLLVVQEYFPFSVEPTRSADPQLLCHRETLAARKHEFFHANLARLNHELQHIGANAVLERQSLCISPFHQRVAIDWKHKVMQVLSDFYCEQTLSYPIESRGDIAVYVLSKRYNDVKFEFLDEEVLVFGNRAVVQKVLSDLREKISTTCEIKLPKKCIKFLSELCSHNLSRDPAVKYEFMIDHGIVRVTGSQKGYSAFKLLIDDQLRTMSEDAIDLSPELHQLFSSKWGDTKIKEVFGADVTKFVYDFEEADSQGNYRLVILSNDKTCCSAVCKRLLKYTKSRKIPVTQEKIRVCTDKKWRELEVKLTSEHFVSIVVNQESEHIIVSGEKSAMSEVCKQIEKFLHDSTSVEEQVTVNARVWNVVNSNFQPDINAINVDAKSKQVAISWPPKTLATDYEDDALIIIRGEPKDVDDFVVQVQLLVEKICHKEVTISEVPAVVHVVGSMEDRMKTLQNVHKAYIDLRFEKGSTKVAQTMSQPPCYLCSATASNGSRVNICIGDFTQNQPVNTILNFIYPNQDIQTGSLQLLTSAAGQEMLDDLNLQLSKILRQTPGLFIRTKQGLLKCSNLIHYFLSPWDALQGTQYLENGLRFLKADAANSSFLITPITSKPLDYPIEIFADKLLEICFAQSIQVTVYVDDIEQARVFEQILIAQRFSPHFTVPLAQSPKLTKLKPISSFISVIEKGDILMENVSHN